MVSHIELFQSAILADADERKSEFSPPRMQNFLSYVSGWLSALGWQALIAVTAYSAGQDILILASLNGQFEPKAWHVSVVLEQH
jgi:choline transport protein